MLFVNGLEDLCPSVAAPAARRRSRRVRFQRAGGAQPRAPRRALRARRRSPASRRAARGAVPHRPARRISTCCTLRMPPLRDYAEDVPELLRYYVDRLVDDGAAAVPAFQRRGAEPAAQLPVARQHPRAEEPGAATADPGRRARRSGSRRSSARSRRRRRPTSRWSSRTCSRCRCAKRASISSAPISAAAAALQRQGRASSPSASAWSARTCIASCARSASISAHHRGLIGESTRAPRSNHGVAHLPCEGLPRHRPRSASTDIYRSRLGSTLDVRVRRRPLHYPARVPGAGAHRRRSQ